MKGQNFSVKTPEAYIAALDEPRRSELATIHAFICKTVPKLKPFILSGAIGYGPFHYRYASGREGDTARIGLASNKAHISLYCCALIDGQHVAERHKHLLPRASVGKSCIRFKRWSDLDPKVMRRLLKEAESASFGV